MRHHLIEAATELLAQLGNVESLTLRAVARQVGVTPASIYNHFVDLDELVAHVMADQYEALLGYTEDVISAAPDPLGRLVGRGWAYASWGTANPGHYRVLFGVGVTDPDAHTPPEGRVAGIRLLDGLIADLRDTREDPGGRDEEHRRRGLLLWAGLHGVISLHNDRPDIGWPNLDGLLTSVIALHAGVTKAQVTDRKPALPPPGPTGPA